MGLVNCLVDVGLGELKADAETRIKVLTDKGMNDTEANAIVKREIINEQYKEANDELNKLKKELKLPQSKITPLPKIDLKEINSNYEKAKSEINKPTTSTIKKESSNSKTFTNLVTKIKEYAAEVIANRKEIRRLSQEAERGRKEGGSRNVEATILLSRGIGESGQVKGREAQQQIIEQYAKEEGIWYDNIETEPEIGIEEKGLGVFKDGGVENQVYLPKENPNIVRKAMRTTDPFNKDNPNEVLYHLDTRISEHNAGIGKTVPYTVIGFGRLSNGDFVVITEQPHIQKARLATRPEIKDEMLKQGYEQDGKDSFGDENHFITDVNPKNVLVDENGNLHFIDTLYDILYDVNEDGIDAIDNTVNKDNEQSKEDKIPNTQAQASNTDAAANQVSQQASQTENPNPQVTGGFTPVTITGLTENQRQAKITSRTKEISLTDKQRAEQAILDKIDRYNKLPNGRLGKLKSEGLNLLNSIRVATSSFNSKFKENHSFDDRAGKLKDKNRGVIRKNYTESGERAIDEKGVILRDRNTKTQQIFNQLLDTGIFPTAYGLDGKRLSEAQTDKVIQDITDGIPSNGANNYLDALEKMYEQETNQTENGQPASTEKTGTTTTVEQNSKNETTNTKEKVISEKAKILADKIRKGKIGDDINMAGVPFLKQIWNEAVEVMATYVELTGDIAQGIKEGIDYIKNSDWYKGLSDENKQKAEDLFESEHSDLLDTPKKVADKIKSDEMLYNDAIEGRSQEFIDDLNKELYGSKKFNLDEDRFRTNVRKQKDYGYSKEEVIETYETIKKLTKRQKELIEEVFEPTQNDKAIEDLQEAFRQLAKGEKPKSVLKRLSKGDVAHLVDALNETLLSYKAVSNVQLEAMADYIVDSIDISKADDYINAMVKNTVADVKQLLRAKLIVALEKEGNTELAKKLTLDMADEATQSGRQTQSLIKAYAILGAKGSPAVRAAFAQKYAESVQERALKMNQHMADVISGKEMEIGKLNEKIHKDAQKSPLITKIKELISNLCNTRGKK